MSCVCTRTAEKLPLVHTYVLVKEITAVGDPWQRLLYCMLVITMKFKDMLVNQQQVTDLAPELVAQHATHQLDLAFEDFLVINSMMVPCTCVGSASLF